MFILAIIVGFSGILILAAGINIFLRGNDAKIIGAAIAAIGGVMIPLATLAYTGSLQ